MKIAFATIATNKYVNYAIDLLKSLENYAFKNTMHDVTLVVYTNNKEIFKEVVSCVKLKCVDITHVPFPLISLLRYHYYTATDELKNYDYVYHIDCDMVLQSHIGEEIFGDRVCVEHPGFYKNTNNVTFPYDRNPISNAFVKLGFGLQYYQNCFQGGVSSEFFSMSISLRNRIEEDLRKNYIALWHDESYMNRYMVDNPPSKVLPPTYAQPQGWSSYGETKILHIEKNHTEVRKS
jgi:histo-blood group ABO system transferase